MKNVFLIFAFLGLSLCLWAQEKAVEINIGEQINVLSFDNTLGGTFKNKPDWLSPQIGIRYFHGINDNFAIVSGLSYYQHNSCIKSNEMKFYSATTLFEALSLPLGINFKLNITKHFNVEYTSGINLSYYFGNHLNSGITSQAGDVFLYQSFVNKRLRKQFNTLLENNLSVTYTSNINLRLRLFGSYHAGLSDYYQ